MATSVIGNPNTARAEIGEIKIWSYGTIPAGWIVCDGAVVSREIYTDLFNIIGTTYGGGDGSTTYAIPDFRGRSPIGVGTSTATGATAHTLGQYAGEEKHTLSTAELASHWHTIGVNWSWQYEGLLAIPSANMNHNGYPRDVGQHTHWTGSNSAHNNMHPYTVTNFIIYTGVE